MFPDIQELSYEGVSEFRISLLFRVRVLSQINSFIHKRRSKTYIQLKYPPSRYLRSICISSSTRVLTRKKTKQKNTS